MQVDSFRASTGEHLSPRIWFIKMSTACWMTISLPPLLLSIQFLGRRWQVFLETRSWCRSTDSLWLPEGGPLLSTHLRRHLLTWNIELHATVYIPMHAAAAHLLQLMMMMMLLPLLLMLLFMLLLQQLPWWCCWCWRCYPCLWFWRWQSWWQLYRWRWR